MSRFVDLHFLNKNETPVDLTNLDGYLNMDTCKHKFTSVLRFPKDEFMGDTPESIGMELFFHTTKNFWHTKLRRFIKPGDMFTLDNETWFFTAKRDTSLNEHLFHPYTPGIKLHLKIFNPNRQYGYLL